MISETTITVRYAETDQMGIVHHSVYPVWFEAARTDFFRQAGYSYDEIEKKGYYLPVSELRCKYLSPAKYGGEIIVKTRISKTTFVKLFFEYKVVDPVTGKIYTEGETVHAWTDKSCHPVVIKKCAPEISDIIKSLVDNNLQK